METADIFHGLLMRLRRAKNEHRLGQGLAAIGKGRLIISDSYETRSVISTRLPSNPTGPPHAPLMDTMLRHTWRVSSDANGQAETKKPREQQSARPHSG